MSLIRIRRERKQATAGPSRPTRVWKLIAALILVILILYYLRRVT